MRRRVLWLWLLVGAIVLMIGAGFAAQRPITFATIATAYAAKQTCSCRYVSGRTMDSCLSDLPEDARGQFQVAEDGLTVRATALFGVFQAEAVYEEGYGCRLVSPR